MSELAMSNEEIVVRYRQAKDKGEQVKILAELNNCPVERIIGILTANGVDNRCFNHLRGKLKKTKIFEESQRKQEQQVKIPYKKPEIIPAPPKQDKLPTVEQAVAAIKAQTAEINRQQYALDLRKADLYRTIWDMLGEVE